MPKSSTWYPCSLIHRPISRISTCPALRGSAADLEAAQLDIDQAQLNLESALRGLEETRLVSPVSGTVIAVEAQVGDVRLAT